MKKTKSRAKKRRRLCWNFRSLPQLANQTDGPPTCTNGGGGYRHVSLEQSGCGRSSRLSLLSK